MLSDLSSSRCRLAILGLLRDGEKSSRNLEEHLSFGASTVRRNLKILLDEGWVERGDQEVCLNPQRRFLLEPLLEATDLFEVYESADEFWSAHDLTPIPTELLRDLGDLAGGRVACGTPSNPLRPVNEKKRIIEESSTVAIATPAYLPEYEDIAVNLLEGDTEAEVLMTREAFEAFEQRSEELSPERLAETEHVTMLLVEDPLGFGLTVSDAGMSLTLHRQDGPFDLSSCYAAEGERAVAWGRRLFAAEAKDARPLGDPSA